METKILNHISIEEADKFLDNSIEEIAKIQKTKNDINHSNEKLIIDYYIYENDKKDKGKI